MNIEVGQVYSRSIINYHCSALVIDILPQWYNFRKIHLKILEGGYPGFTFYLKETHFLKQFVFNQKLTDEYLIKSIIE